MQMIEELLLALIMSLVFALPAWYLCIFQGSFAVFWLAWLLSLADGIGATLLLLLRSRQVLCRLSALDFSLRAGHLMLSSAVSIKNGHHRR